MPAKALAVAALALPFAPEEPPEFDPRPVPRRLPRVDAVALFTLRVVERVRREVFVLTVAPAPLLPDASLASEVAWRVIARPLEGLRPVARCSRPDWRIEFPSACPPEPPVLRDPPACVYRCLGDGPAEGSAAGTPP